MCTAEKKEQTSSSKLVLYIYIGYVIILFPFCQKLKCRKAALSKTSTMTDEQKKKWMPCLVPDLMSSEESDDECDGEEQSTFKVHPLLWRSDKVTAFIKKLDLKNKSSTSQQSKRMAMKRSMGLPSDRLPPDSLSDWMVKNTK